MAKKTAKRVTPGANDAKTIRLGLVDLSNELLKLLWKAKTARDSRSIERLLAQLNTQLMSVLRIEISKNTNDYRRALKDLGNATRRAKQAVKDIKKITDVIKKAAQAAKAVDKVLGAAADILL